MRWVMTWNTTLAPTSQTRTACSWDPVHYSAQKNASKSPTSSIVSRRNICAISESSDALQQDDEDVTTRSTPSVHDTPIEKSDSCHKREQRALLQTRATELQQTIMNLILHSISAMLQSWFLLFQIASFTPNRNNTMQRMMNTHKMMVIYTEVCCQTRDARVCKLEILNLMHTQVWWFLMSCFGRVCVEFETFNE